MYPPTYSSPYFFYSNFRQSNYLTTPHRVKCSALIWTCWFALEFPLNYVYCVLSDKSNNIIYIHTHPNFEYNRPLQLDYNCKCIYIYIFITENKCVVEQWSIRLSFEMGLSSSNYSYENNVQNNITRVF